jgi:hypothetical protein
MRKYLKKVPILGTYIKNKENRTATSIELLSHEGYPDYWVNFGDENSSTIIACLPETAMVAKNSFKKIGRVLFRKKGDNLELRLDERPYGAITKTRYVPLQMILNAHAKQKSRLIKT